MNKSVIKGVIAVAAIAFIVLAFSLNTGRRNPTLDSKTIGVVDYSYVVEQTATIQGVNVKLQEIVKTEQEAFNEKVAAGLSEQEAAAALQQAQGNVDRNRDALYAPINAKVDAMIHNVAQEQGLVVVLNKGAVAQGGIDITKDVMRKIAE